MKISPETIQAISAKYLKAYYDFVEGRTGTSPQQVLTEMLSEHPTGRKMAILRRLVPADARVSGQNTLAGLLHDANRHFGQEVYRGVAATEGAAGAIATHEAGVRAVYDAAVPNPAHPSRAIVVRDRSPVLARTTGVVGDVVDEAVPRRPGINYRIHQVGGAAEVSGPGVLRRDIPVSRVPSVVTPPSTPSTVPAVSRWSRLRPSPRTLKWGGRALGALAVADLAFRAVEAVPGHDDKLRAARAVGNEADLAASNLSRITSLEEDAGKTLDRALSFRSAADIVGTLNAEDAASQQVQLEITRQRNDLLGIALRSEPTMIEQVAAMQRFME